MERVGLPILDDRDFVGHGGPDPQGPRPWMARLRGP